MITPAKPEQASLDYVGEILYVGGVALPQFPDYVPETTFGVPASWPTLASISLASRSQPITRPTASAAVFKQNEPAGATPWSLIDVAEQSLGQGNSALVVEDTVTGPDRRCHFRVRFGPIEPVGDARGVIGTVVAAGTSRPSVGVIVHGGPDAKDDTERITRDIAMALCAAPA